ncbi:MAG TPA: hypothetical protein VJ692_02035, partial [Nitrospiraceae bacterium]|nr:hypothetical protein [Nitrospiraceae bacterium]
RVSVTVLEHAVRVTTSQHGTAEVSEGGHLSYGMDGRLGVVEQVDLGRALAWRRHRVVFENQPIAAAAAELNRYRPGWILLRDPALSTLTITGVFDTRDPDRALQAIQESLPVRLVRVTDRLVLLYRGRDTRQN